MKIVIAPDSFKESLTSSEVASELEAGLRRVWPDAEYVKVPMADGGEGTVQSLVDATGGEIVKCEVMGPMGQPVLASYGLLGGGKTAVVEMAEASGLPLVPRGERNPLLTTTYGTGQLVVDALRRGVTEVIVGLGGSATNDGGAGFAQALGVTFIGSDAKPIVEPLGGGRLGEITAIDMSGVIPALANVKVSVASDVTNPLTGPTGASAVYGPQKGATPEMVALLDKNLAHLASLVKRDLGRDVTERPGAGAGGGLGYAMMAFTTATVRRGIEIVVEATDLDSKMQGADLAITGEGRVDFQTAFGKTPSGVAASARRAGVPVVAIGGGLSEDAKGVFEHGIDGLEACTANPMPLEKALANARTYLQDAAERVARLIVIGHQMAGGGEAAVEASRGMPIRHNRPIPVHVRVKRMTGLTQEAVRLIKRRQERA